MKSMKRRLSLTARRPSVTNNTGFTPMTAAGGNLWSAEATAKIDASSVWYTGTSINSDDNKSDESPDDSSEDRDVLPELGSHWGTNHMQDNDLSTVRGPARQGTESTPYMCLGYVLGATPAAGSTSLKCKPDDFLEACSFNRINHLEYGAAYPLITIHYRCADSRFLMSPRGMAVSNTRYLSSCETRVNAGIRGWKLHLSEST